MVITSSTSSKKNSSSSSSSSVSSSVLGRAFFSGQIRDTTTKQSRKAAGDLALLKNKSKNPQWTPMNAKVFSLLLLNNP